MNSFSDIWPDCAQTGKGHNVSRQLSAPRGARYKGNKMSDATKKWILLAIRAFLTLAFLAAGLAKLAGAQMMVDEFGLLGIGQWFRYATGIIEIGSVILLWVPGRTAYGAALQGCVVVGALIAHIFVLGMGTSQGVWVLGPLALIALYFNRAQIPQLAQTA